MSLYYRTVDERIIELDPAYVASLAESKRATLLPHSIDPKPTPTATQYVVAGPVVVAAGAARKTWQLAEKTAEQLADEAFTASQAASLEQARAVYAALKAGAGTAAERLVRVERVCAYYLRAVLHGEPQ